MSRSSLAADLRSLDSAEKWLFCQAWLLLFLAEIGFRLAGFKRVKRALSWLAPRQLAPLPDDDVRRRIERCSETLTLASRHVLPEPGCLPESLVLWVLLRRRGVPAVVRLGVRRHRDTLHGHAWVEHAGKAIGRQGLQAEHYRAFEQPAAGD